MGVVVAKKQKKIRVELVRSPIGRKPVQRRTVKALGLGKIGSSNDLVANDAIRGMVATVAHLVKTEEIE